MVDLCILATCRQLVAAYQCSDDFDFPTVPSICGEHTAGGTVALLSPKNSLSSLDLVSLTISVLILLAYLEPFSRFRSNQLISRCLDDGSAAEMNSPCFPFLPGEMPTFTGYLEPGPTYPTAAVCVSQSAIAWLTGRCFEFRVPSSLGLETRCATSSLTGDLSINFRP